MSNTNEKPKPDSHERERRKTQTKLANTISIMYIIRLYASNKHMYNYMLSENVGCSKISVIVAS